MEEVPLTALLDEIKRRIDSLSGPKSRNLQCGHPCLTCASVTSKTSSLTPASVNHRPRKNENVFEYDFCSTHDDELNNWCCKCQEATCKTCPEKHYSHGIVLPEDMYQHEVQAKLEKVDADEGKKLSDCISASIDECTEGLKLMNKTHRIRKQFNTRKKHLLKQQQLLRDLTEALEKKETVNSAQAKHWKLLKTMSRAKEDFQDLEAKSRSMCADLTKLTTDLETTHTALQKHSAILYPSEVLPNDKEWTIHGEYDTKKAIATLRNSGNKASGPVTVISTHAKPILSLSELLKTLAEGGHQLKVKLLDSFWARTAPPSDYVRLEPFLKSGHGSSLLSIMGHLTKKEFEGLDARYVRKIGLRINAAEDAEMLHARQDLKCYRHFCVSTQVVPDDIKNAIPEASRLFCLHFVGLKSHEFLWLRNTLQKLAPSNRSASVYLPESSFSAVEVQSLLEIVEAVGTVSCVWLEAEELTDDQKKALEVVAKDAKTEVKWKFEYV